MTTAPMNPSRISARGVGLPASTSRSAEKACVLGRTRASGWNTPGSESTGLKTPENAMRMKLLPHVITSAPCPKRSTTPMLAMPMPQPTMIRIAAIGSTDQPTDDRSKRKNAPRRDRHRRQRQRHLGQPECGGAERCTPPR